MALIPTREVRHVLEGYQDQDLFTEGNLRTVMTEGWYSHPSLPQDQLIERKYVTINQFGHELHKVIEEWNYDRPGGPPKTYHKEIWSKAYIPQYNTGRGLKKMEEETTVFWTFAPFAPDALAYRREVDGVVVYNLKPTPSLSTEGQTKVEARGQKATGATEEEKRYHIASALMWSEATRRGATVEKADANQTAKWVKGIIVEEVSVAEEPDRYTQWGWRKNQLRPDDIDLIGPNYFQKERWQYQLDVPVEPPRIQLNDAGEEGVRIVIRGGGAEVEIPLSTGGRRYPRGPEEYRVYRKKIDEAEREPTGDPWGIWEDDPPPDARRSIIVPTFIGGYDGVPDESATPGVPPPTSYSEPHDPTPFEEDDWRSVGSVKNEAEDPDYDEGYAVLFDKDVTTGSTYVYAAVAVVQGTESELSNQPQITYQGGEPRTYSISVRVKDDGTIEADLQMPDDPGAASDPELGDVYDYDIPAMVDDFGFRSYPADIVTLTAAKIADAEQLIFYTTPKNVPDAWAPGSNVIVIDTIGAGKPNASGTIQPYFVKGTIVTTTATSVTIGGIAADGHTYPVGSSVEVQLDDYMSRIDPGVGDLDEATIEALILAVGMRQGLKSRDESFTIDLQLKEPVIGLQTGAEVIISDVSWDAWGNDLWMKSQIEEVPWVLRGWSITVSRDDDGKFQCDGTKVTLEQR